MFTLRILSDTPGGFQWLQYIFLMDWLSLANSFHLVWLLTISVELVTEHCEALTIDLLDNKKKEVGGNECHKVVDNNKQKSKEEIF
jgi:hypothetical protein